MNASARACFLRIEKETRDSCCEDADEPIPTNINAMAMGDPQSCLGDVAISDGGGGDNRPPERIANDVMWSLRPCSAP